MQRLDRARTSIVPVNMNIGDYVVIRPIKAGKDKLSSEWMGPMRVVGTMSAMVFVIESFLRAEKHTVLVQHLIHLVEHQLHVERFEELMEQAECLDTSQQVVRELHKVLKKRAL